MTNITYRPARRHRVFQDPNRDTRTVWRSKNPSKVKFYASASNDCQGLLELSIAAIDAFKIEGDDRVLVFGKGDCGWFLDHIVDIETPDRLRRFMNDRGIPVAA